MSEEDKNTDKTGETGTSDESGKDSGKNNNSNVSQDDKTGKDGQPKTVPYERFKEVNDKLKELEGKKDDKTENKNSNSSESKDSPEDRVLELVGKVPPELKDEMSNIAKYMREHSMTVEDTINLFKVKKGLTVSKDEVDKFHKANDEANDSRTGGNSNSSARNDSSTKQMSDADLDAAVQAAQSRGEV